MAAHKNHAPPAAQPAPRAGMMGRLRALPKWLLQNRLRAGLLAGSVLLGIIGLAAAGTSLFSTKPLPVEVATLEAALSALDTGDYSEARRLAGLLRTTGTPSYEELGGPLFVLGAAVSHAANENTSAAEKKSLYALAARYLEESRSREFPADRQSEGLWLLGSALHESGQVSKSIPVLRSALATESPRAAGIHRLLARSYFEMTPPKLAEALDHNRLYLAQSSLTPSEREAGALLEAEIELARGDHSACRAALEKVASNATLHREASLLSARLSIREGDAVRGNVPSGTTPSTIAAEKYRAAQDSLQ